MPKKIVLGYIKEENIGKSNVTTSGIFQKYSILRKILQALEGYGNTIIFRKNGSSRIEAYNKIYRRIYRHK